LSLQDEIPAGDIRPIIKKVTTPFYYYSSKIIERRFARLKKSIPDNWKICFAVKANPNVSILNLYKNLGANAECSSAGEMLASKKAGFKTTDIILSGPVKSSRELSFLQKNSLSLIHAESFDELSSLNSLGKKVKVALRVNPNIKLSDSKTSSIMIGGKEKFGFSQADCLKLLREKDKYKNIEFVGFHIYFGTGILSSAKWVQTAGRFMEWVDTASLKTGFRPSYINLGGGFGIPYKPNAKEFDLTVLKSGLKKLVIRYDKNERFKKTCFYIEPGRYLVGPAGVYVMKVLGVKKIRNQNYLLMDGGVHHALFPFRLSKEYPVKLLNRKTAGKKKKYILGGQLCTTLDQSQFSVTLPEIKVGDTLGIYQSGAYGYSASMNFFLSHSLPAELLDDGTTLTLIRKPSESKHLFENQTSRKIK